MLCLSKSLSFGLVRSCELGHKTVLPVAWLWIQVARGGSGSQEGSTAACERKSSARAFCISQVDEFMQSERNGLVQYGM